MFHGVIWVTHCANARRRPGVCRALMQKIPARRPALPKKGDGGQGRPHGMPITESRTGILPVTWEAPCVPRGRLAFPGRAWEREWLGMCDRIQETKHLAKSRRYSRSTVSPERTAEPVPGTITTQALFAIDDGYAVRL